MSIDLPDLLAIAAAIALALPPLVAPASVSTIAVGLCGGGVVHLALETKGRSGETPGGCHAACALRRGEDDRDNCPGAPT